MTEKAQNTLSNHEECPRTEWYVGAINLSRESKEKNVQINT